jgi:hypothetical protein
MSARVHASQLENHCDLFCEQHAYFADGLVIGNQLGPIHFSKGGPAINSCNQVRKSK